MIYNKKSVRAAGYAAGITFMLALGACSQYLDINKDPNNPLDAPIETVLTGATVNVGFTGGSDLFRYAALIAQQLSGQGAGNQTVEYERYNITGSDANNLWNSLFTNTLVNLNGVITKAAASNSPAYSGVAKILKAYTYQLIVDAWGKAPYSQALQTTANTSPVFDDGAAIYTSLFALIDDGIKDINTTSAKTPDATSTIYTGAWATQKLKWERFANALKMRMYIHYSKKDKAFAVKGITDIVNSASVRLMTANTDNFEMPFTSATNNQNATDQFERSRVNYLFPNATLVNLMNAKADPRRPTYFTSFPFTFNTPTSTYKGAMANDPVSIKYSRIHIYLRGDTTKTVKPNADGSLPGTVSGGGYDYTGAAPTRMLTFAEYNFIRAEAALYGAPGDPQAFFQAGITASMQNAGVAKAAIDAYILANGTLKGTDSDKLKQIIEEKFVASFGVIEEPWTDLRRTGYPALNPVPNAITPNLPRSLFYPQSEIDVNKNAPPQKASTDERVFWDAN